MHRYCTLFLFSLLIQPLSLFAFKIHPHTLKLSNKHPQGLVDLRTSPGEDGTFSVNVVEREVDLEGNETHKPSDEDFFVFPSQVVLKSGQHQTIRIIWKNKQKLDAEKMYRVVVTTLPVKQNVNLEGLDTKEGNDSGEKFSCGVNVCYSLALSLYVRPDIRRAEKPLQMTASLITKKAEENQKEQKGWDVEIYNPNTVHAPLKDYTLLVHEQNDKTPIEGFSLQKYTKNSVPAKQKRHLFIPLEEEKTPLTNPFLSLEKKK